MPELIHSTAEVQVTYDEEANLIHARWSGVVDKKVLEEFYSAVEPTLVRQQRVNYFNDFSELGEITFGARWTGIHHIQKQRPFIIRSAICGSGQTAKWLFEQAMRLTGRTDVRMFDTEEEAISWLLCL